MNPSVDPAARIGRSLQARLLGTVLSLMGAVWIAVAVSTWIDTSHELNELLDAHLSQAAALLVTQRLDDLEGDDFPPLPQLHKYQARVAIQVWHEGRLVVRSTHAPTAPLGSGTTRGLSDQVVEGKAWRVLTAPGREADVVIHVGELESARRHILTASLSRAAWPILLALPLLALGVWWAVRGAVRPLRRLGQAVAARRPESLEPLAMNAVPREVDPLVQALNELFGRMAARLESERRFTADAAHELRTPIAAIRMQVQVAQGAQSDREREQALADTLRGCDRAARLVEQLLQLAHLESEAAYDPISALVGQATADMAVIARGLVAELEPQACARGQRLALDAVENVPSPMPAPLAQVLLRNLIDNALRYSPDGAQVRISVGLPPAGGERWLVVEDSGPGLKPDAMMRLGERFFRVVGSPQTGSGLGWSIVRRLVRLFELGLVVDHSPALGGLRVTVTWQPDRRPHRI
jgi:two-component system sensor histidine kinase QseC